MTKAVLFMAMSLDGYVNDRAGSVEQLYPDLRALRETKTLQEAMQSTGAVLMGRRTYEMAHGDFTGYEFQVPIFVVTHRAPERVAKGQNERLRFVFVTDGVERAMQQARAAAGDLSVSVVGGASIAQQCLHAGLLEELHLAVMPLLLGEGQRLFEPTKIPLPELDLVSVVDTPTRTELRYRTRR